jgi:hypothetical protein
LFSLACVLLAQTSILVLFLAVVSWRLLEDGRDRTAGATLAWLTIKPQLTGLLLLGTFLHLLSQRRWRVIWVFGLTLAALVLVSTLAVPTWPSGMVLALRESPSPTEYYPWIGNAWFLVLKSWRLEAWLRWTLYLALAAPLVGAVVRVALDRTCSTLDVMALGFLAAFFVAPYARHYDFPVLLLPLVVLLRYRLGPRTRWLAALAWVILPYVQTYVLVRTKPFYNPGGLFLLEGTFFWVPSALAAAWLATSSRERPTDVAGSALGAPSSLPHEVQGEGHNEAHEEQVAKNREQGEAKGRLADGAG